MSLDIALLGDKKPCERCATCWDCHGTQELRGTLFSSNVTHNLVKMAKEAGIYGPVWRPDETNITQASQLIKPIEEALEILESEPDRFTAFNPSNEWGSYDGFVNFLRSLLVACRVNPNALIEVSR